MPLDLTPLVSGTESLTPVTPDARTMVPLSGGTEALTPETGNSPVEAILIVGTLPGPTQYPDAGPLCGLHLCGTFLCGEDRLYPKDTSFTPRSGLWLEDAPAGSLDLTPLQED